MPLFPKIQSPCPYRARLTEVMDGDHCRMCDRTVFDLSAWSGAERAAFLAGCAEEVCVSYRAPVRIAAAAMAAAALTSPVAAAAQPPEEIVIVVGGIKDPKNARFVDSKDAKQPLPELPVVYDDAPQPPAKDRPAKVRAPDVA